MEQLGEQKKLLETEMMENMKEKMDELQRQREMEIQEREAQKKKMEIEMEQLRKEYTTKMEKERIQMPHEMKQQKSLEMIEFLSSLEKKKKKNETMQLVTTTSAAATEIENKIEEKLDSKTVMSEPKSEKSDSSDQEWEKPEAQKQMSNEHL